MLQSPVEVALDGEVSADLSWEGQLALLRGFSQRFGALHEAQALQLKLWPFAVDPGLPKDGQEAHVDLEGGLVRYVWVAPERASEWTPDEDYKERLEVLARWTRWMLGDKFRVEVSLNDKTIFVASRDRKTKRKRKNDRGRKGRGRKKRK